MTALYILTAVSAAALIAALAYTVYGVRRATAAHRRRDREERTPRP